MKIALALFGLVILLPQQSEANFLRHVVEADMDHATNGGRMLQSCVQDCQYDRCTVAGEGECLREANEVADQKWAWCVSLDGKYDKWQDSVECGSMLKKPKYNCAKLAKCVEDKHCSIYRFAGCDVSQAVEKAEWVFNSCQAGQYEKIGAWNPACTLDDFPFETGKEEFDCSSFEKCVQDYHCLEYPDSWCDGTQAWNKGRWAKTKCDDGDYEQANVWKKFCPIEKFKMDKVCDAFRECMVKVKYNQNIAKKLDTKVSTCMSERRFEKDCDTKCNANCPCGRDDMEDCAELYDKCRADGDSKKCFKKARKKSYKDCCCLAKECADSADGYEGCGFLMSYNNRAGSGSSDDPPLPIDHCSPNPCQNNGMCINDKVQGTFVCKCAKGYEGSLCEQEINYCSSPTQCGAHGTCYNKQSSPAGFVCICDPDFEGKFCEQEIDSMYCSSTLCGNHGTCIKKPSTSTFPHYHCVCDIGFQGKFCEQQIGFCSSNLCGSHGTCVNKSSSYVCRCDPGYEGEFCTRKIDYCNPSPCMNGGICQNNASKKDGYECFCRDRYAGKDCEFKFGAAIEYRYICNFNTACRCYDSDCEHSRGTYESYDGVTRRECEKRCNENGQCNGIEYNANEMKCEVHTDGMMDRKEDSSAMCCEKREMSINRAPDSPSSD